MERTARRSVGRVGHVTTDDDALSSRSVRVVQFGHDRQQRLGVGMQRRAVEQFGIAEFDDLPEVHHADAVRNVTDHTEVVSDE